MIGHELQFIMLSMQVEFQAQNVQYSSLDYWPNKPKMDY